jgi:surface antigen/curli biogenesis system outer membrane secretion channel CsgG
MMQKLITFLLTVMLIQGCSGEPPREATKGEVEENTTRYSQNLECLGKLIEASGQGFDKVKFKAAVGKIQDKTGKREGGGTSLTQAASEMALTALGKIKAIDVVGPLDINDMTQMDIAAKKPTATEKEMLLGTGNIGSIIKSNFFLAGAISEYNDDIGGYEGGLDFFRKYLDFGFSGTEKVLSVAMDLRLIGSKTGNILRNEKKELLTTSLKNSVHTKEFGGVLMRIFNVSLKNGGVVDYAIKISDPKHLAIREIIEEGTFKLIGKLYDVPFEEQCPIIEPFQKGSLGGSVAQYMNEKDQAYAQQVLESIPTKEIVEWKSFDLHYTMLATTTYEEKDKPPCREYYISMTTENRKEGSKGKACREINGFWKDV